MRAIVIVNPRARRASDPRLVERVARELKVASEGVHRTRSREEAVALSRRARERGADTVVAVGGDGTVSSLLPALAGSGMALGVIPRGTANDLAARHEIPADLPSACDVIRCGHRRKVDLVRVDDRYYATGGGVGLPCEIVRSARALKRGNFPGAVLSRLLGNKLYIFAALKCAMQRRWRSPEVRVRSSGRTRLIRPLSITISNQANIGGRFCLAPGARDDDGLVDVCLIESNGTRRQALEAIAQVLRGTHSSSPHVTQWRTRDLVLSADRPLTFAADGELLPAAAELQIRVVPRGLDLLVPATARRTGGRQQ